jgi:hypothetical protein
VSELVESVDLRRTENIEEFEVWSSKYID